MMTGPHCALSNPLPTTFSLSSSLRTSIIGGNVEPEVDAVTVPDFDGAEIHEELREKLAENQFTLLEISATANRILQLLNEDDLDIVQVDSLISRSPVLAGEILKIVNFAAYYRGIQIKSLPLALQRLGLQAVKGLLYMPATKLPLDIKSPRGNIGTAIVEHSYAVAQIANYLSHRFFPDPDRAFLGGSCMTLASWRCSRRSAIGAISRPAHHAGRNR
jgi:hypothetical protein